jgi:hypothetical protein
VCSPSQIFQALLVLVALDLALCVTPFEDLLGRFVTFGPG